MTRFVIVVLAAVLTGCCPTPPPAAPSQTADAMESAIDQMQKYLLAYQADDLAHPPAANNTTDLRRQALADLALLSAGISSDDPRLAPALALLKNAQGPDPNFLGLRLQILGLLWQQRDPGDHDGALAIKKLAVADAAALAQSIHQGDPLAGLWSDADDPAGPAAEAGNPGEIAYDCLATDSALAGLAAADRIGANVPARLWALVDQRILADQCPDGGWTDLDSAAPGRLVSAWVTLTNLHALLIIQPHLMGNAALECNGNFTDDAVENAGEWVAHHFDEFHTPHCYWAIEQIAAISGYRDFGRTDWFAALAPRMMTLAGPDERNDIDPIADASLKLLFLANGSAPVAFTKLDYSYAPGHGMRDANWNQRPMDALNLTNWIAQESELNLNWQIAALDTPLDAMHDSPILYLAGDQIIRLTDADIAKLRQFVLEGGLILGNADCDSYAFKKGFIQLGEKMFPLYEFRELGRDDQIFTGENYTRFRGQPRVVGLSNGVRDLMLLLPTGDPARTWQAQAKFGMPIEDFQLGADIFLYATDAIHSKGLRPRGDSYLVHPDPAAKPTRTLRLARLMLGDNPDPEPAGWPRLAAILHNPPCKLDLEITVVKPGDSLAGFQIVHLTGTTAFKLSSAERQALIDFTRHGGTLILDAAGGSATFANSAEKELSTMFPNALAPLPFNSPVFTLPPLPIPRVSYRGFARRTLTGDPHTPRLQAVQSAGRYTVFFSPYDLSAGLVGEQIDGIAGYTPASATDIMRNLVLYCAR